MVDIFILYLKDKGVTLSPEETEMIRAVAIQKKLRKRQFLLEAGDVNRHKAFVVRGLLRLYRVDSTGSEHLMKFAPENWWISDRESYVAGIPSEANIDSLEDSEVILITKENWDELHAKIPTLKAFEDNLLARSSNADQNRIYDTISLTAEEKYEKFARSFPDLFNRVPLHMVASYLGVSRETLSRIRKSYTQK